jgi:CRP-like cAMP-binding protein
MKQNEIKTIENIRLFSGFSPAEREQILVAGHAVVEDFTADKIILHESSKLSAFMILLEGRAQGVHFHSDGALDLVQFFVPGDIVGLDIVTSSSQISPFSLCATEECSMLLIDYHALFSSRLDHSIMRNLHEKLIHEVARDSLKRLHKIEVLYRKSRRERICVFLRNRAALSGGRTVEIDMDREQFAQYLGVNRSSLSHELAMMREGGLIDFHKGSFTILSDEVLK